MANREKDIANDIKEEKVTSDIEGDPVVSDSDEEEEEEEEATAEDLKFIADDEEEEEEEELVRVKRKRKKAATVEALSDDDLDLIQENTSQKKKLKRRDYDIHTMFEKEFEKSDDDLDEFIIRDDVDEDDEPIRDVVNLGLDIGISDSQWRDIDELFGTGDDYPHAMGLEINQGDLVQKNITLKDVYEPSEIQAKMLTEQDEAIRIADVPERYQRHFEKHYIPDDNEISREANIITKTILQNQSNQSNEKKLNIAITCVLRFLRKDQYEVPFIHRHKRDYFDGELQLADLWRIVDLDDKFVQVELKKKILMDLIVQISTVDSTIESDEQVAHLVEKIVTMDDVNDTLAFIHLKYSLEISQYQSNQSQRRLFKKASWKSLYDDSLLNNIGDFCELFKIDISKLIESIVTRQSLHLPEDHFETPIEAATKAVSSRFPTADSVLEAARHMIAQRIAAHPQIRAFIRRVFLSDSIVNVSPTEKGQKEIEQHHPFYPFTYLKKKPIVKFVDGQFLQLLRGELDGLFIIDIRVEEEEKLMADIIRFICNDYVNDTAQLWNAERIKIAEYACKELLFPQTVKWLKERTAAQNSEVIAAKCQITMESKINMAPYRSTRESDEAPVVISISWGDGNRGCSTFAVVLNENGEMIDFLKLERLSDREKADDCNLLINLIRTHKPDVIVVGGFKPNTKVYLMKTLQEDVINVGRAEWNKDIPLLFVNDEVARIYMNSKRSLVEFPENDYPSLIRYLVALGRYVQEPTLEYAGLCNPDDDIKNVKLDPLQHLISDELLYRAIERAFLVVVNKCGVDVNAAASFPHLSHTLQFVCGLGPRKSQAIISKILRSGGKLGSRAELVQKLGMGPTIFVNCASFIRIRDFHFHGTFYDFTLDVLDDSRVHPEDYRLARQMAVDALDLEDAVVDEDENPSAHVQELIETDVERLNTLMLDDYALELERRMHCPKRICLIDIKDELMNRYRDTRQTFQVPNDEQIFTILSGESRDTLYEGAIISVVVTRVHSRYFHVQLGSGLYGFVPGINTDVLPGDDLTQMYQPDQALLAYVTRVNYERLSVELSTKQHDVETNKTQLRLDQYFDLDLQRQHNAEKKSMKKPQIEKQVRQIQHPYWQNINYRAAEKYLASRPRGEIVVRPSSSGKDHISITWKVDDGIYQHIDVLEQNKTSEITLGKRLIIEDQVFTEIDQILAEFVEPMTRKIALLIDHPKYQRKNTSEMCMFTYFNLVEYLNEQVKVLKRSAYGFIICSEKPGSFFLVYRHPANSPRQETVTVRPFGFEFRKKRYQDINDLLASFKQHEAARATEQKRRDGYIPTRIDPRQAGRDTRAPDRRQAYPDNRGRAAPTDAYRSSNTYGSRGY